MGTEKDKQKIAVHLHFEKLTDENRAFRNFQGNKTNKKPRFDRTKIAEAVPASRDS